jgi:DNA (cytosine-5)-methyltransferase 1
MIVDLFAGPGGWSEGLRTLGLDDLGIEWEPWACATRRAAGHAVLEVDVATVDPADHAGTVGLIASPPCQLYSAAGKGYGRDAVPVLAEAMTRTAHGDDARAWAHAKVADLIEEAIADEYPADGWLPLPGIPTPARAAAEALAANAVLVLEPARWVAALRPRWVALEQVPAVLPLWEVLADALRVLGYSAEVGILNAADYGVPQTRRRAILVAHRDRPAALATPTHAKGGADGRRPWVSMAEALGWDGGPDCPLGLDRRADYRDGVPTVPLITPDKPAPTLTGELLSKGVGLWRLNPGRTVSQPNRRLYDPDGEPAPTVAFGHDAAAWVWERPATTIAGDARVWPPGHKINADDVARLGAEEAAARYGDRAGTDAIRVSVAEALTLQSFDPAYPVQGPDSAKFEQIGNAVPPRLAAAILATLVTD